MNNVDMFLSQVENSRRLMQAEACRGFVMPHELQLPSALDIALEHRWLIAPVDGRSNYALHSGRTFVPSREREEIEYWYAHNLDANWIVQTGARSGVMALEIDPRYICNALVYLAAEDDSWQRTLRFPYRGMWFALFAYSNGMRTVGERYLGLRLHAGDPIFIPPSVTLDGIRSDYADSGAPLLPAPKWLINAMQR